MHTVTPAIGRVLDIGRRSLVICLLGGCGLGIRPSREERRLISYRWKIAFVK